VSLFSRAQTNAAFETLLKTNLIATATDYLHPLYGGSNGEGWDIGEDMFAAGLFARLQAVIGDAGFISKLTVLPAPEATRDGDGNLAKNLDSAVGVGLLDFEMVCSSSTHSFTLVRL
jgi:hypothetical protein